MSTPNSATRSAAMTGAALATVALGSAAQVAFYLRDFGASHRTDGFIAAFAVYSLVVVLAQILRTTAVPLLTGPAPRLTIATFAWAMAVIALLTAAICEGLASPLAHLLAGATGVEGRRVAEQSLRVMAPAAGLQIVGAGLAVSGAVRERLVPVAFAYMASAIAGLVAFFPLRGQADERVLAWTMLIASIVLVLGLLLGVGVQTSRRPSLGAVSRAILTVLHSMPVPASFVFMYPITLALAPHAMPGQITLFGLALTACSYLAGFTGQGLSMVDAVELARIDSGALIERRALVTRAFRYSMLVAAPGFAVAVVAGGPLVGALLPSDSAGSHTYFATDLLLLAPWMIATLGLWAVLPALLAHARPTMERWLGRSVIVLIVIHIFASGIGRALAGFNGLVAAMAVAPAVFVTVAVWIIVPTAGRELMRTTVVVAAMTAASFGVLDLGARAIAGAGALVGVMTALVGVLAYAAFAIAAYPEAARTVWRLVGNAPRSTV